MSVDSYSISLLSLDDCPVRMEPADLVRLLEAWRLHHGFEAECVACSTPVRCTPPVSYAVCCGRLYFSSSRSYSVQSIAVPTPGYVFGLQMLLKRLERFGIETRQDFLVLPDPIFWQMQATIQYEKTMRFVRGQPLTKRSPVVLPPEKAPLLYQQILEAPLNYGSLQWRLAGKNTLFRLLSYGKRTVLSMRGIIVPDASLPPNCIRLPSDVVKKFHLLGKWILLNRMPTLQPGSFVALQVLEWENDCFGIPLEIAQALNADFDGDECNIYMVPNALSQAECATLLNPEAQLYCPVMRGPKLAPCQDMLVAYHLFWNRIDFLPYKHRTRLAKTFRALLDVYGSEKTFGFIDGMRKFYRHAFHRERCLAVSLRGLLRLVDAARGKTYLDFVAAVERWDDECLVLVVRSGAKGSFQLLYQMFGKAGERNSFWTGLDVEEGIAHAEESMEALSKASTIWQPGYDYSKMVHNVYALVVTYDGQVRDGETVVEEDVLYLLHYTDVMSDEGFRHLMGLEEGNPGLEADDNNPGLEGGNPGVPVI